MDGFQLTFYTQQDRTHGNEPLAHWLLAEAKKHGIRGATLIGALEGFGHSGVMHAAGWFDLADQPVQVTMIVTAEECDRMFHCLQEAEVTLFYTKAPVSFGFLPAG